MSFSEEYAKLRKKRLKEEEEKVDSGTSFSERYAALKKKREEEQSSSPSVTETETKNMTSTDAISLWRSALSAMDKAETDKEKQAIGNSLKSMLGDNIPDRNSIKEVKDNSGLFKSSSLFDDGLQFQDIPQAFAMTQADLGLSFLEGMAQPVEGLTDLILYGAGGIAKLFGADTDEFNEFVSTSHVQKAADWYRDFTGSREQSYAGELQNNVMSGLGQIADMILLGELGAAAGLGSKAISVANTGFLGASSMGGGIGEALQNDATMGEALAYGALSGAVEAGSEMIFGGLGKGLKVLGLGKGLSSIDDQIAKKISSGISNKFFKSLTQAGVKASAEGLEEVLAGIGTAAAKKLTYLSEEEFGQLLEDENLWESFLSGAIVSGIAQMGDVANSTQTGRDVITGLTKNEQAVVDKVYEKELANLTEQQEKVTGREKSKLYDDIIERMEKGQLNTDDIESVLGGDAYKAYKETLDKETSLEEEQKRLQTEYDTLGEKKNPTLADQAKFSELKTKLDDVSAKIEEGKKTSKRDLQKAQLSQKVYEMSKGDRLVESYFENVRKTQKYEADLSKYSKNQKAFVQKAVDSGVLNNSNTTHELVDLLAKIHEQKGIDFDFTNNKKLAESGFALKDATVNGFVSDKGITLNVESKKELNSVVGHEVTHVLEGSQMYDALAEVVETYAKTKGEFDTRLAQIKKLYTGKDGYTGTDADAKFRKEVVADLVGDYIFNDKAFVQNLSTNRNVFQKIYDEIKYLYNVATAGSEQKRQLEKAKKLFAQVWRETKNTTADGGTKLSIESLPDGRKYVKADRQVIFGNDPDSWSEQVKNYINGKIRNGENITLVTEDGDELVLTADTAGKIASNKTNHGTTMDDAEFYVKANAGVHIDELAQISVNADPNKKPVKDRGSRHGAFAEGGWTYRYAFFQDFDGKYYRLKISAAMGTDGNVVYNIGDIEERSFPKVTGSSAKGGALNGKASFEVNVPQETPGVNPQNEVKVMDGGTVTKFSLSTWTPETQDRVRSDLVKAGYGQERVDKWISDTNGVAAVIAADKDRLDFEAADNQVMLKDNQEYIKTLDASTLCAKRLVYQGTFDAIQHRMPNTMLSSDDLIDLLNMMKEKGVQTPCGVCYVESRRRHLGKFAQEWLNSYDGEYKPNLDEVTTSDGLETLRKSHPQTYKDFVDAMNKKGSSNPKVVQLRTEYRNEIMSLTPAQIRKIEAIGGLRVQSFSDFETPHLLDMMQAVMDMSAKGLHSQAYTKVPNFAWVFGDTGIKINLSLIAEGNGFDANGNLAFSSTEGMDIDEAMKLRDAYSQNVGTIIVGANDQHILACMADDRIDFIIPFHRSGWGMKELDMMGMSSYTDYTYGQKEHDLTTGKGVENLYPPDYWDYNLTGKENAERYLSLCAKTNREPKFSKFLVNNGDGSYSLQPDGSTDGYWKMLIDFKMYDNDGNGAAQQKVQPNFNMNEAYRVLNEYEGGANKLPVAKDIVEEFVAKYQAKDIAPTMSLSAADTEDIAPIGWNVRGEDVAFDAPMATTSEAAEGSVSEEISGEEIAPVAKKKIKESVGAAPSGFDPVSHLQYEYGTIPEGEHPVRDDSLPKSTNGKDKVSRTARTVKGAEATPDELVDLLDKETVGGRFSYIPIKNSKTVEKAYQNIVDQGWESAKGEWTEKVRRGEVSADLTATGALLLNNAAKAGDRKAWLEVLHDYQLMGTNAGQAVQAMRILKTLSPDDSLYMIERSVEQMVQDMKLGTEVVLDEKLKQNYLDAKNDAERDTARKALAQDIASQIPSTAMDKWTALRYLNMLGNLRTQGRNIFGNVGMSVTSSLKNTVAAALETIAEKASGGKFKRTKSFAVGRYLLKAARNDFANVETVALNGGKFNDPNAKTIQFQQEIQDARKIFKFAPMEKYRRATNFAMDKGDLVFSKAAYGRALAGYLKANGITETDFSKIDQQTLDEARAYAVKQAQEQTFRDNNWLSSWVSKMGRRKDTPKIGRLIAEGVMPFRKTPANILLRAEEYSPLGLVINAPVKSFMAAKGINEVTGADAVNSWAKALTGTGLLALGMLLNNSGFLSGGPDEDEDKDWFEDQYGWQNYAIQIGDYNFTIDFLSPSAMPLLMGAQINEMRQNGGIELKDLESALLSIADPMIEMSMLQGVNDTLENIRYAESNMGQFLLNSAVSYLTQGLTNSMLGQLERSFEGQRMTTYVDKDSGVPAWLQKALGKASAKIPGWDYHQMPYVDAWGETEDIAPLPGLLENTLSPSYIDQGVSDFVYEELNRLNDAQSDINVYPQTPDKTITFDDADGNRHEDYNLSAEEYEQLATLQGTLQKALVEQILSNESYDGLSDKQKAKAVQLAYKYAKEYSRQEVLNSDGFSSKWMAEAEDIVTAIIAHTSEEKTYEYDNPNKYALSLALGGYDSYKVYSAELSEIKADKKANGDTISGSRKKKVLQYLNDSDLSYGQKILLYKSEYPSDTRYDQRIVEYIAGLDMTTAQKYQALEALGFKVDEDGNITSG